jgi:putative membrane protein
MTPRLVSTGVLLATLMTASAVAAKPKTTPSTQDFVQAAGQSDNFEIMAGRAAVAQSQNPAVRGFAEMMIREHGGTSQALQQAASHEGLQPPPMAVGDDQSRMLNALQSLKGADFDQAYMRQQVIAHHSALVTQQGYAATGADPAVKRAAADAVPLIRHHLDMAEKISASLGGS